MDGTRQTPPARGDAGDPREVREGATLGEGPVWVFAYGSLIWNPGFEPAERRLATLRDFRRSFSMRSFHHRGSEALPGLVLALDFEEGAACRGVALRLPEGEAAAEALGVLRERELVSSAYVERSVRLETGAGTLGALAFVMSRDHPQYAGGLPLDVQAGIIATAHGGRGPNDEYLFSTVEALASLDIRDEELERLADLVRARRAA
jgi:cation transport protein ChaC